MPRFLQPPQEQYKGPDGTVQCDATLHTCCDLQIELILGQHDIQHELSKTEIGVC